MDFIQKRLRNGEKVELEGVLFEYAGEWTDLEPGDWYAAERNTGPKLLTVAYVKPTLGDRDQFRGAVFAVEPAYPFDLGECVKVRECVPQPA